MKKVYLILMLLFISLGAKENKEFHYNFNIPLTGENGVVNFKKFSMENAALASKDLYDLMFFATDRFKYVNEQIGPAPVYILQGLFAFMYPSTLSSAWLHEEFHIQALDTVGAGKQYDETNEFTFKDSYSVYGLSDQQLSDLKRDHPKEWVRSHSAGYEAQIYLTDMLSKDNFFSDNRPDGDLSYGILSVVTIADAIGYVGSTTSSSMDEDLDKEAREESIDPTKRDHRGFDFTTWVYDLFRQDLSFNDARLDHPKGTGKLRGVKFSQLNDEEKDFLKNEYHLTFLNIIDPMHLGIKSFNVAGGKGNFNIKHYLAPFGHTVDLNLMYKKDSYGLYFTITQATNYNKNYYGGSVELVDYKLSNIPVLLSVKGGLFTQPSDLDFRTTSSQTLAVSSLKATYSINKLVSISSAVKYKSKGFVVGVASLKDRTYVDTSLILKF